MQQSKIRFKNIDIARGLGILIVIAWHCKLANYGETMWVMPLFFFIMGLFYKQPDSFLVIVKKKTNHLLIPFIIYSIPYAIYFLIKNPKTLVYVIFNPYKILNGPSWFLICMFECYCLYYLINKIREPFKGIAVLLISLFGFYLRNLSMFHHHIILPFFFNTTMTVLAFIYLGDKLKKIILNKYNWKQNLFLCCTLIIIFIITDYFIGMKSIDMFWNKYDQNYPIVLFNSVIGIIFVIFLGCFIPNCFSIIGEISLLILLTHSYFYNILGGYIKGIPLFITTSVLSIGLSYTIYRYVPALSGEKKFIK